MEATYSAIGSGRNARIVHNF